MQRMTDCKYTAKVIFSLFLEERKRDRRMYYIGEWKQQFLISVMLLTVVLRHQDIYIFLDGLKGSIVNKWFAWGGINFWINGGLIAACANQTFNSNSFILGCVQLMPCSYVSLLNKSRFCFGCVCKKRGRGYLLNQNKDMLMVINKTIKQKSLSLFNVATY